MIKLNTMFEKNKLNINKKDELLLVELEGFSLKKESLSRKKLNISLCVDVSGSMSQPVNKSGFSMHQNHFDVRNVGLLGGRNDYMEIPFSKTKLDYVKEAAVKALSIMKDGDIISIVEFDTNVKVVKPATIISQENRIEIIKAINSLTTKGMTNLHGGWLSSVEEVAKNVKSENLNRVILLTDGQINTGKGNVDDICSDVFNVAGKNVSTSTFGVGENFNELLLSSMSDSGNGNFYFINDSDKFGTLFSEEFTGLSNICATDIKMKLSLNSDILKEVLTTTKVTDGVYSIQDLTSAGKIPMLFNLNTENLSIGKHTLGFVTVNFKDIDGNSKKIEKELKVEVTSNDTWDLLDENQELKVQELLMMVAKNKLKAKNLFESGDRKAAQDFLRTSSDSISASFYFNSDSRLSAQSDSLSKTILSSDNQSLGSLSKSLHYESYRSLKGKL